MTNWEQSLKLILLQLHEKLPKNSVLIILWSFGVRSKLERWRKLISGNLMSWPKTKKIVVLKCDLLFYTTTTNHSSIVCNICVHIPQSHVTKIGLYVTTGSSLVVGLRRSSKGLPEPHMHQKMVTLVVCCRFDTLQLSESQWNNYIWEVCSANQWGAPKTPVPTTDIGQ